ncbi:RidA family protein [Pseudooceanicola sp. 216_PA32_1]|uniref:RidA family protein n=1 Tax=Pseudooceanicola pacificus TaxID=2676438 RepID=A0A844WED2_9RHOB|nr:RidA family protein [Pseudooceanicola pacificus]MWB78270.1 RidA family protein [Pseudooceanicola pacificus]
MRKERINPPGVMKHPAFNRIITVEGPTKLIFFSGQTPQTDDFGCFAPGDLKAQYRFVMDKLQIQLDAVGATWSDVVVRKLYLTDFEEWYRVSRDPDFPDYFGDARPTSTGIGVTRLAHPDFMVEVDLIAAVEPS